MEKIKEYVQKNYPKTYKDKNLTITENDIVYFISTNKDESPLIINKEAIYE